MNIIFQIIFFNPKIFKIQMAYKFIYLYIIVIEIKIAAIICYIKIIKIYYYLNINKTFFKTTNYLLFH